MYKEIISFIAHQREVIRTFERDINVNSDEIKFITSLRENIKLFEERIDRIVDGSDKE
jgi:hypothetical protein